MTWEQEINIKVKEARAEARAEALEEGVERGHIEKAIETAKNLFEMQLSAEQISKCTGLPLEQVLELQKAAATR